MLPVPPQTVDISQVETVLPQLEYRVLQIARPLVLPKVSYNQMRIILSLRDALGDEGESHPKRAC